MEQPSSAYYLLSIHLIQVRNYLQATGDSYMGNAYQAISNHIIDQIHILPVNNEQGKSEGFDSCDRPSNLTQIGFKWSIFQSGNA